MLFYAAALQTLNYDWDTLRDRPAITSLRLLAVLNVLSSTPALVKRRAPRTDGPLTHFASPRGEKSELKKLFPRCLRDV